MKITVLVKPNSKKEGVFEQDDGSFVVRVNTPPVDGKANKKVIDLLAKHFKVPKTSIELLLGSKSKKKIFNL